MAFPSDCNSDDCASQIDARRHKGICPSGWHLPSNADWNALIGVTGGGTSLKATSGWEPFLEQSGNGTDACGFAALPGGAGNADGNFFGIGDYGHWWHTSDNGAGFAVSLVINKLNGIPASAISGSVLKSSLLSVRCIKD
jgi:uncharacterized protein (TIGR02145 family)